MVAERRQRARAERARVVHDQLDATERRGGARQRARCSGSVTSPVSADHRGAGRQAGDRGLEPVAPAGVDDERPPRAASASASASPRPCDAPVTTATGRCGFGFVRSWLLLLVRGIEQVSTCSLCRGAQEERRRYGERSTRYPAERTRLTRRPSGASVSLSRRSAVFSASAWVLTPPVANSSHDLVVGDDLTGALEQPGHDERLAVREHDGAAPEAQAPEGVEAGRTEQVGPAGDGGGTNQHLRRAATARAPSPRTRSTAVAAVRRGDDEEAGRAALRRPRHAPRPGGAIGGRGPRPRWSGRIGRGGR